mgnify:CR=1 FL=1
MKRNKARMASMAVSALTTWVLVACGGGEPDQVTDTGVAAPAPRPGGAAGVPR